MKLKIKVAIFDLDGTTLDSSYAWADDAATLESVRGLYATTVFGHKPGIKPFLEKLKANGTVMTVATANLKENAENALRNAGLLDYFSGIYTPEDVGGIKKEQPVLFTHIAEKYGATPAESVVFEDAMHNLRSAVRGGFGTVGVYDVSSDDREAEMIELVDIQIRTYDSLEVETTDGEPWVRKI